MQQEDGRRQRLEDIAVVWLLRLRTLAALLLIVGAWGLVALIAREISSNGVYDGDAVYVAVYAAIALGLTVLLGWSMRAPALRRALAPLEVGALIGALTWLTTLSLPGRDPYSGEEGLAFGVGIFAAIVLLVATSAARGRARERAWMLGVVGVLCAIAVLIVPLARWDGGGVDGSWGGNGSDSRFALSFADDGAFSLAPIDINTQVALSGGYEPHASRIGGDAFDPMTTYPTASVGVATPASNLPPRGVDSADPRKLGSIALRVVDDGSLRLDVELDGDPGDPVLQALLRRGSCDKPDAVEGSSFQLAVGAPVSRPVGLRLTDLTAAPQLMLALGSGTPLAPVRCVDLVDRAALAAAQLGAATFGTRCVVPLQAGAAVRHSMTAASFQDRSCADDWSRLARVAAATFLEDDAADMIAGCLRNYGLDDSIVRDLPGDGALVDLQAPGLDPRAFECAVFDVDGDGFPDGPA